MRAAQITRFGAPDALRVAEVDRPEPGPGEVLVRVEATSVNGHDVAVRTGELKLMSGRRFPIGVGLDFAGVVEATGAGVRGHRAGDRVWGTVHPRRRHTTAAAAEYVVVRQDRIGTAPAVLTSVEAASLAVTGTTALLALRDGVHVVAGERVLVRGASGGVGTAAVQLARALGAHVTALARAEHAEALEDLGAAEVLDYRSTSPAQLRPFDVVVDTVGQDLLAYRSLLARGGRMVTVGLSPQAVAAIARSTVHGSRRIRAFSANPERPVLDAVAEHVSAGALRPVVHGVHPLAEVGAAQQAFERGGVLGKHVITVAG